MRTITLITLFISSLSFANLHLAPPSFDIDEGRVIMMDIKKANYKIIYDTKRRKAKALSKIYFETREQGMPLFDLVPSVSKIFLDGEEITQRLIALPDGRGPARVMLKEVSAGEHELTIQHYIKENTRFRWPRRGVRSGFFIRDLKARKFLEQYLPTNLEFDQYPMTIEAKVTRAKKSHQVMANGEVKRLAKNHYQVTYPDFYTASSVYFHLFPYGKYRWKRGSYTSMDGRKIPITIYAQVGKSPRRFYKEALRVFKELENDYGPWPYPSLLVFASGLRGGMEWPGATTTTFGALDHEMLHSYFAKGVMPANGNSGWMDEGIASWRDKGYQTLKKPEYDSINLGNQSPYMRNTDDRSYAVGRSFFGYLDYQLQNQGGLKPVLKKYFAKRKYSLVTTQDMINDFQEFTGINFQDDFNYFVLGLNAKRDDYVSLDQESEHHPKLTKAEMDALLD